MDSVFLFDGDCAFCSSAARWLIRHVPTGTQVSAWQHVDLDRLGVPVAEVAAAVVLVEPAGRRSGAQAIAALLCGSRSRTWRGVGRVMTLPLIRDLAALVYRQVAANRHRLPGGTPQCALGVGAGPGASV
jgi:predicted DCC family thiol-disulfide oxidoreductase YuxK